MDDTKSGNITVKTIGQFGKQEFHRGNHFGFTGAILTRPCAKLAINIARWFAKALEPKRNRVKLCQCGKNVNFGMEQGVPVGIHIACQGWIKQGFAINFTHDKKLHANDIWIIANGNHPGNRYRRFIQCFHDAKFAINRMC